MPLSSYLFKPKNDPKSRKSNTKIVQINHIGAVPITKHPRAKYIKLKIHPTEGLKVTIPKAVSFKRGIEAIQKRKEWILKNLELAEIQTQVYTIHDFPIHTRFHMVNVKVEPIIDYEVERIGTSILVSIPFSVAFESPENQIYIQELLTELYRKEAKVCLPKRLSELAGVYGFSFNKISIRNQKSRWGSCSYNNNISLNLNLMKLPDELIDYVLLHELCHTKEKNHGAGFWHLMNEVTDGRARTLDRKLKAYNPF